MVERFEERLIPYLTEDVVGLVYQFLGKDFWIHVIREFMHLDPSRVCLGCLSKSWKKFYVRLEEYQIKLNTKIIENEIYHIVTRYFKLDDFKVYKQLTDWLVRDKTLLLCCRLTIFYNVNIFNCTEKYLKAFRSATDEEYIQLFNNVLVICACNTNSIFLLISRMNYDYGLTSVDFVKNLRGEFKKLIIQNLGKKLLGTFLLNNYDEGLELLGYKWDDEVLRYTID